MLSKCSVSAEGCYILSPSKQANADVVVLTMGAGQRVGSCGTSSDTACGIYFCNLQRTSTPKCNPLLLAPTHTHARTHIGSGFYTVEIDVVETIKETSIMNELTA